jgi:hypothetical protein
VGSGGVSQRATSSQPVVNEEWRYRSEVDRVSSSCLCLCSFVPLSNAVLQNAESRDVSITQKARPPTITSNLNVALQAVTFSSLPSSPVPYHQSLVLVELHQGR